MTDINTKFYYTSGIPRIDPDEKAFWIEKLLSEEFKDKQGYDRLETLDGNFCCLGVYCNAKGLDRKVGQEDKFQTQTIYYGDAASGLDEDYSSQTLPKLAHIPFATNNSEPAYYSEVFKGGNDIFCVVQQGDRHGLVRSGQRKVWSLPMLNDSKQFTFAQIADIIRYFL